MHRPAHGAALAALALAASAPPGMPATQQSTDVAPIDPDELDRLVREAVRAELEARGLLGPDGEPPREPGLPAVDPTAVPAEGDGEPALDVHGGVFLWHYEPTGDADALTEIYAVYLLLDVDLGDFGFHLQPRLRDTKLRPYFTSNVWLQEAYVSWAPDALGGDVLKAGKVYSRLGKFWDGSFFGNVPYLDGLKLDPDLGLSLEGSRHLAGEWDFDYALQLFPSDGRTNGSLQDRDTLSVPGGRQRDELVARFAPVLSLGEGRALSTGISGQAFRADLGSAGEDDVLRGALDVQLDWNRWTLYAEHVRQAGRSVVDFPLPGMASDDVAYWWSGVEHRWGPVALRFNYSTGDYDDADVRETIYQPGIVYTVNENLALMLEFDYWERVQPGRDAIVDRSLNFVIDLHF